MSKKINIPKFTLNPKLNRSIKNSKIPKRRKILIIIFIAKNVKLVELIENPQNKFRLILYFKNFKILELINWI